MNTNSSEPTADKQVEDFVEISSLIKELEKDLSDRRVQIDFQKLEPHEEAISNILTRAADHTRHHPVR